ncbi:MAG TPA: hypothetical protein VF123_10085 [Candidatus Sulfotelmatobacter sp.]
MIVVSALLIVAGAAGLIFHLADLKGAHAVSYDLVLVSFVRLMAVVIGMFMLTGRNWARWLAMAWITFHVIVSAFHPVGELAVHLVLFGVFAVALFHRAAAQYFSAVKEPAS